jgi:hypothetical protein
MVALPPLRNQTRDAIYASYEARQGDQRRGHLGASQIGKECERQLWYGFRWCLTERHDGRLLRLFDTGHLEEPRMVKDLRAIGCTVMEVDPDTGRQFEVRDPENGHFGGSADGVALGVPEAQKTWHLCEFKTSNDKKFRKLEADGVREAQPQHFAQMQVYMHLLGLTRALYLAKNKNTDDLYCERVKHDATFAMQMLEKGRRIVFAARPPEKKFKPDFYLCRWCAHADHCHGQAMPERNCRTCLHSEPAADGTWICARHADVIPDSAQRQRHPCHRYIPDLLPFEQIDVNGDDIVYEGFYDNGT